MSCKKRAASEELTSDNLKQARHDGEVQHSDDETSGNKDNLTSSATGASKQEASNHVEPSAAPAINGQGLPTDGHAATTKPDRPIATPRRRSRSFITTPNGHGSFYHHHPYAECTDAVRERRTTCATSIRSLLGDDSASWLASSVKPKNLPSGPCDWSTTLLEAILNLAQAVQGPKSQSERRKSFHDAMIAKSPKRNDGRPACLGKSDFEQAVIWLHVEAEKEKQVAHADQRVAKVEKSMRRLQRKMIAERQAKEKALADMALQHPNDLSAESEDHAQDVSAVEKKYADNMCALQDDLDAKGHELETLQDAETTPAHVSTSISPQDEDAGEHSREETAALEDEAMG